MIDKCGLGKPGVFTSKSPGDWAHWSFKFRNYITNSGFPKGRVCLDWAQDREEPISEIEVGSDLHHVPDAEVLNDQLFAALAALLDGEALDILMNTTEGQGFEAWREISKRFDPKTKGRTRNKLIHLLTPGQCTLGELSSKIEQWEESVRRYGERSRTAWSDDFRVASLTSMCPKVFQDHIGLNQNRLAKYEDVRNEVFSYLEMKHDSQKPTPMDVGSWDYEKGGKGKGKKGFSPWGEGKGGKESGKGYGKQSDKRKR